MKKRVLSLLGLAAVLVLTGCNKNSEKGTGKTLTIATSTEPASYFFTTVKGNNGTNSNVRDMIYGHSTVSFTKEGSYEIDNVVVKEFTSTTNADGGKTYTIEINPGLKFSDGTEITAKDYVGGVLVTSNPMFYQAAEVNLSSTGIYEGEIAYTESETGLDEYAGFDLISDYKFSVTVLATSHYGESNYPYYYEWNYYNFTPYPLKNICPGFDVVQGTTGAKLVATGTKSLIDVMTEDMFNVTNGYMYKPAVSSGPYRFHSYDAAGSSVTLTLNEHYGGNYEGQKPTIENIIIRYVAADLQLEALKNNEVQLIEAISGGATIRSGLDAVTESGNSLAYTSYARSGYGQISFHCDSTPTRFTEVRQAVAYLLNRSNFMETYTGGYGVLPNGEYGLAQWMVKESTNEDGNVVGINPEGQEVALNSYSYNPTEAARLVEEVGFVYGAANKEAVSAVTSKDSAQLFNSETHTVRYRWDDATNTPEALIVVWNSSANNPVSETLKTTLVPNCAAIGFIIENIETDFNTLLYQNYYGMHGDGYFGDPRGYDDNEDGVLSIEEILAHYEVDDNGDGEIDEVDARTAKMFNLATGFNPGVFEPYYGMAAEYWGWDGGANINYFYNAEMARAARNMMEAATDEAYLNAWKTYQYYYNYFLPNLPLYSDEYHEFFTSKLQNYRNNVTADWNWTSQLLYCTMD